MTPEQIVRLMYRARTDPSAVEVLHDVLLENSAQYRSRVELAQRLAEEDFANGRPLSQSMSFVVVDPKKFTEGFTRSGKRSYERSGYKMLAEHPFVMVLEWTEVRRIPRYPFTIPTRDGWKRAIITHVARRF